MALGGCRWLSHHRSTMACISRIRVRRSGAFSQRDRVGCEARSSPLSGRRPQASLNCRIFAQIVQVIAIRITPAFAGAGSGDREDARAQDVTQRVGDLVWITVVGD